MTGTRGRAPPGARWLAGCPGGGGGRRHCMMTAAHAGGRALAALGGGTPTPVIDPAADSIPRSQIRLKLFIVVSRLLYVVVRLR